MKTPLIDQFPVVHAPGSPSAIAAWEIFKKEIQQRILPLSVSLGKARSPLARISPAEQPPSPRIGHTPAFNGLDRVLAQGGSVPS